MTELQLGVPNRPFYVVVQPVPQAKGTPRRLEVSAIGADGVQLVRAAGAPAFLPADSVPSVSTFDPWRGARDGALALGLPLALAAVLVGTFTPVGHDQCVDGCPPVNVEGFKAGAAVGALLVVLGAGVGALAGHEDRYVFAPR